jgi:hypothetical protein
MQEGKQAEAKAEISRVNQVRYGRYGRDKERVIWDLINKYRDVSLN